MHFCKPTIGSMARFLLTWRRSSRAGNLKLSYEWMSRRNPLARARPAPCHRGLTPDHVLALSGQPCSRSATQRPDLGLSDLGTRADQADCHRISAADRLLPLLPALR